MKPAPLQSLRVLDLTTVLAGPYCTYQLALLGAEIIKIERPGIGDWARNGPRAVKTPEFSAQFLAQNAGKKSIVLDLKSNEGIAAALKLVETCDILVENFAPGVAERLGLGYEATCKHRPDIVYCSLSGYGHTGPMSARPAYDHVIQAASGITTLIGTKDTVPNRIGPPLFDYLAGIYGSFAIMAALRERDRTGQPQRLDVAMLDVAMAAMASTVSRLVNGDIEPRPNGNTAASGSPASGIFKTTDGLLAMTANQEPQVIRLCHALGLEALLQDDRYSSPESRLTNADSFRQQLSDALRARSASEWEELLSASHIPVAKVRTVGEILGEPHLQQREVQQHLEDPATGEKISVPTIGFRWNEKAIGPDTVPPRLGEHTAEILGELGFSHLDTRALLDSKAI